MMMIAGTATEIFTLGSDPSMDVMNSPRYILNYS